jgi:hypothetical protein
MAQLTIILRLFFDASVIGCPPLYIDAKNSMQVSGELLGRQIKMQGRNRYRLVPHGCKVGALLDLAWIVRHFDPVMWQVASINS